jgi:hypothetical protein
LCVEKFGFSPTYQQRKPAPPSNPTEPGKMSTQSNTSNSNLLIKNDAGTYLTATVKVQNTFQPSKSIRVRLVLDSGSARSYITEKAIRNLNLPRFNPAKIPVSVFGSETANEVKTSLVTFTLKFNDHTVYPITANEVNFIAGDLNTVNIEQFQQHHPELTDRTYVTPGYGEPIDLLIGNDYLFDILQTHTKLSVQPGTHLINSKLGWFLVGKANDNPSSTLTTLLSTADAVEQLWSLDTLGITDKVLKQTEEEQLALDAFYHNIKLVNQRYEVSFPWRDYPPPVPTNYGLALGCLTTQLRKFLNQPAVLADYNAVFNEQEELGIIEAVEMDFKTQEVHYIPHHAKLTPDKSTRLRIVYKASAKTSKNSQSLNDCIYKGATLLSNLLHLALEFRLYLIALIADIEKAFHQIGINENDRDYVRFLWVKDITKPPTPENLKIYWFTRLAFGIISSPFLMAAVLKFHLQKTENSTITDDLHDKIYVDNLITGSQTKEDAQRIYRETVKTFETCGMNIRNWTSNSPDVRETIPPHHCDTAKTLNILGLQWNVETDTLSLK